MVHVEPEERFKLPPRGTGIKSDMRKLSGLGPCAEAQGQRQGCLVSPLAENKVACTEMPGSRVQNKETRSSMSVPALLSKYQAI